MAWQKPYHIARVNTKKAGRFSPAGLFYFTLNYLYYTLI